jgi:hypothetical protein
MPEELMMKPTKTDKSRRSFLRQVAATGVAAGAAAASVDAVAGAAPDVDKTEEKTGYRLTDHVRAYYESLTR